MKVILIKFAFAWIIFGQVCSCSKRAGISQQDRVKASYFASQIAEQLFDPSEITLFSNPLERKTIIRESLVDAQAKGFEVTFLINDSDKDKRGIIIRKNNIPVHMYYFWVNGGKIDQQSIKSDEYSKIVDWGKLVFEN